jgi:hypothetical protein
MYGLHQSVLAARRPGAHDQISISEVSDRCLEAYCLTKQWGYLVHIVLIYFFNPYPAKVDNMVSSYQC